VKRLLVTLILTTVAVLAADAPADVYLKYHKTVLSADDPAALLPYLSTGGRQKLAGMPSEQRVQVLGLMKALAARNVKVVKTQIDEDKAMLYLQGLTKNLLNDRDETSYGRVEMVREAGVWKVDGEHWGSDNKPP